MENTNLTIIKQLPITEIMSIGKAFAESGMFNDVRSAAQAIVKIQAGQEIGIPPFAAMTGIHIISGKPTIGAGIIASRVKGSGKYDYKVVIQDEKTCSIDFYQGKEKIGNSTFTIEDARKAGTKNIDKFARNMLFARAISNGVRWYCPDVFSGPVYVPQEMDVEVNSDDEVIQAVIVEPSVSVKKEMSKVTQMSAKLPSWVDDKFSECNNLDQLLDVQIKILDVKPHFSQLQEYKDLYESHAERCEANYKIN